jgi:hypothetical protein
MTGRRIVRALLVLLCVVMSVAAVENVLLDNDPVRALALQVACGAESASCAMTRMERTPIEQTFEFTRKSVALHGAGTTVEIVCRRALIAVGDYTCLKR